ncbi:DUF6146 family protein [Aurantibacter aestuarii]|uniref:Lipoprotein n=1 Tax=Aurantibacter aestuarii TaxID=1266046 RepID=A0A2T1NA86_9FLAO|nr:DUF6146 family protein [Aurantibacter aestuarii]PSG88772.1 hypothetical protein C7H52_07510 [Aurantibacter aestuarii]
MKNAILALMLLVFVVGCNSSKTNPNKNTSATEKNKQVQNDTVRIVNEEAEYEVIIIEPGFNTWLASRARPREFYTQSFLEARNIRYVTEWNNRVLQPQRYNPNLYELQINYYNGIDYGYEVNYLMYNYFIYFQNTYKQNLLGGRVPVN